jgi:hypothetical protein
VAGPDKDSYGNSSICLIGQIGGEPTCNSCYVRSGCAHGVASHFVGIRC